MVGSLTSGRTDVRMSHDSKGSRAAQSLRPVRGCPVRDSNDRDLRPWLHGSPPSVASLTSLPWAVLVVGWLAFALAVAAIVVTAIVSIPLGPAEGRDAADGGEMP